MELVAFIKNLQGEITAKYGRKNARPKAKKKYWDSSAIKEQKKQAEFDERYSNLCEKLKRK